MTKPRIIRAYEKLTEEEKEQIKLVYPLGFSQHLVSYTNKDGERKKGLPLETEQYYYLIRMTMEKAEIIIDEDDDYDESGALRDDVKAEYEDRHEDVSFLNELNSNEDNDLGED